MYHKAPFALLSVALALGILSERIHPLAWATTLLIAIGLLMIVSHLLISSRSSDLRHRYRYLYGLGTIILLFSIGQMRMRAEHLSPPSITRQSARYTVSICETPKEKPATLRAYAIASDSTGRQFRILLQIAKDSASLALCHGDQLTIHAKMQENDFAYDTSHDVYRKCYVKTGQWHLIRKSENKSAFNLAQKTHYLLLQRLQRMLSTPAYSIAAAMTLGYKRDIVSETRQDFADAGVSHLLAVSGLHIGFIYAALHFLCIHSTRSRWRRLLQFLLILAGLWSYVVLCGMPASALRSGLMFTLLAIANLIRRKAVTLNSLFSAAFILLFWQPFFLFDIGFQLSFSAVLGILLFAEPLEKLLPQGGRIAEKVKKAVTVSSAAQLGTLPFCLYYFQQFPLYFPISNLLAIPMASLLVYGTLILLLVGDLPLVGQLFGQGIEAGFHLLQYGVQTISRLPSALLQVKDYGIADACLTALLIACIYSYGQHPKAKKLYRVLACIIFLLSWGICQDIIRIFPNFACN